MSVNREDGIKSEPGLLLRLQFRDTRKEHTGGWKSEVCEVEAEQGASGILDVKTIFQGGETFNCDGCW